MSHPPVPRRCDHCEAPAVLRFALALPGDQGADALRRRPQHRCFYHWQMDATPRNLAIHAGDTGPSLWVIDAGFVADAIDVEVCGCGLPADHRNPGSGEPRPCVGETVRMIRVPDPAEATVYCAACLHPRAGHADSGKTCGYRDCSCSGFVAAAPAARL